MTRTPARWLALGAVAGPILLTLGWIVLGLMRPEVKTEWGGSDGVTGMITQPFSGLGLGTNSFLINAAFVLRAISGTDPSLPRLAFPTRAATDPVTAWPTTPMVANSQATPP